MEHHHMDEICSIDKVSSKSKLEKIIGAVGHPFKQKI